MTSLSQQANLRTSTKETTSGGGTLDEQNYEDPYAGGSTSTQNISQTERWVSLGLGAVVAVMGLKRGKLSGLVFMGAGAALIHRGVTGHCHGYQLLGMNTADQKESTIIPAKQGCQVERAVTIAKPASVLYSYWRDVENLPKILRHIQHVEKLDQTHSRWTAHAPLGMSLSWNAEIFNDRANELIAWRSMPGSDVISAGTVRFEPLEHNRGTVMRVTMRYNPPGGKVADKLVSLLGIGLQQQIEEDLHRFKSSMEAGEVPTINGQPRGD